MNMSPPPCSDRRARIPLRRGLGLRRGGRVGADRFGDRRFASAGQQFRYLVARCLRRRRERSGAQARAGAAAARARRPAPARRTGKRRSGRGESSLLAAAGETAPPGRAGPAPVERNASVEGGAHAQDAPRAALNALAPLQLPTGLAPAQLFDDVRNGLLAYRCRIVRIKQRRLRAGFQLRELVE